MKNILILDDNRDILETLSVSLRDFMKGCNIMIAETSKKGLEVMSSVCVDLVLTDLDMPRVNGLQFIEEARKCHPGARFCVMSGAMDVGTRDRLQTLGVTRMIRKPFPYDAVIKMINEELGGSEASQGYMPQGPVGCKDDPC